uniref:tetratricopeptide repeat-containing sensor histidine kinase n=1 Tax=Gelidibacter sp. TaxID=2018083 RepID=UPI00404A6B13
MKKLLPIIFILFFTVFLNAQQKVVDSLLVLIESNKKSDSIKVKNLLKLSYAINSMDNDKALEYAENALEISNKISWQTGKALSYRQKGLVLYYKSDYMSALLLFQKALNQSKQLNNALLDASIYNNIGNIYSDIEEYEKALDNYNRLLEISQQQRSINNEIIALTNIATVNVELKKYNDAIQQFIKCIKLAENNGYENYIPSICNNISRAYQYVSNNSKAEEYLVKGVTKARELNDLYTLSVLLRNLAQINYDKNDLKTAQTLLLESISISEELNVIEWKAQALNILYEVYEKQNNPEKALNTYKDYIVLRDSIINDEKKSELIKRDLTFENDKKQALANAEIERQKLIKVGSILGGSFLLLSAGAGIVIYKRKRDAVAKKHEAEFKATVANTELKALRAQMNPHFIFNSLNSIGDYVIKNDKDNAKIYLAKFAKLMRQTLEHSNEKEILLKDDLELLELYLQMENQRLGNKFTYTIDVDNQIDVDATLVPPMILQPFVENSVWHGISKKTSDGHIFINVKKEDEMIVFTIEDNGVGFLNDELNHNDVKKQSLGQNITQKRIEIINKKKQTNGKVNIINKPDNKGVFVEVKLPLEIIY